MLHKHGDDNVDKDELSDEDEDDEEDRSDHTTDTAVLLAVVRRVAVFTQRVLHDKQKTRCSAIAERPRCRVC